MEEFNELYNDSGQQSKKVKILIGVLMLCFAAMAVFGGWKLYDEQKEYKIGADIYTEIAETFHDKSPPEIVDSEQADKEQEDIVAEMDFDALRQINSNIIGWINGCDDTINYPIVTTMDNNYYLTHLVDGTVNRSGSIFIDSRNNPDFTDRNTFIYGHNMLNGTMFSSLTKYVDQDYYNVHPALTIETPECEYLLQPFSGYVTPGTSDSYRIEFYDDDDFAEYIEMVCKKSNFRHGISITPQDKIVTLSTCTYDYEDARYVLHCKITVK